MQRLHVVVVVVVCVSEQVAHRSESVSVLCFLQESWIVLIASFLLPFGSCFARSSIRLYRCKGFDMMKVEGSEGKWTCAALR